MAHAWQSYDSAAAAHDRVAVPSIFSPPARDLVVLMGRPAGSILDVGTGTGTAARAAREFSAPGAAVIGVDPSLQMLRVARNRGLVSVVTGGVPGLPFATHTFDAVLANFVLAHVADYRAALVDMVRVLRSGGRLGVTAWAAMENPYRLFWQSCRKALNKSSKGSRGKPSSDKVVSRARNTGWRVGSWPMAQSWRRQSCRRSVRTPSDGGMMSCRV